MTGWVRAYFAAAIGLMAVIMMSNSGIVVAVAGVFTGLIGVAGIAYGIRTYRPAKSWIWYILLLGVLFTSFPKITDDHELKFQGPIMVGSGIGNLCFIAAPLLLVRAHGGKDRDEEFDGWMLTLALAVGLRQFLLAGQADGAIVPQPIVLGLTAMAGITVAASIRLTFIAGRNASACLLLAGSISGQFIGVSLAMANSGLTDILGADILAGFSRLVIGGAAMVSSMATLTSPAPPRHTKPHGRLILLSVALSVAILGVFFEVGGKRFLSFAGFGIVAIVALLIARMIRLINERERARTLQELVAYLGMKALTDDEDVFLARVRDKAAAALDATVAVVPRTERPLLPAADSALELRVELADASLLVIRRDKGRFSDEERICAEAIGVTVSSATRRYRSEEQIRHASLHDALTGLPNRAMFQARLEQAVAANPLGGVSVLFIDLDRFKSVNDSLGHQAGDELLIAVAERIRGLLASDQLLARLAGDEFVVLCPGTTANRGKPRGPGPQRLAELISAKLAEPFALSAGVAEIGGSVGLATHDGSEDLQKLIHRADTEMYRKKVAVHR